KKRPDLNSNNINLLEHYLLFGVHEGTTPNEFFDQKYYLDQAGGSLGEIEPLIHYSKIGWKTGLNPSEKFDISLYLSNNQDVLLAGVEPLSHYLNYGAKENRSGLVEASVNDPIYKTGLFASNWYLETNEDLRDSNINPLLHFTLFGLKEQRNPNPFFDIKWYTKKYLKGIHKDINPILHYAEHGWKAGNNPSPKFDTKKYIKKYKIHQEPLAHYLNTGKKMGYTPLSITDNTASQGGPLEFDQHSTLIKDAQLRALIDYDKKELSPNSITYK
ncbi:hypothetical protein NLN90_25200, partial [Citrobacter portucalensis]|nr:hypothetical protein [Citrobacter portucalensis]